MMLAIAGCNREQTPTIHYLPGIVPGSQNVFRPLGIAVTPTTGGESVPDKIIAGGVYDPDGNLMQPTVARGLAGTITKALATALADAGLKPITMVSKSESPPEGADVILDSQLESAEVWKQFSPEQTVHGQYFTMDATVKITFELRDRTGKSVFTKEIAGVEHEPPKPVGHEVFFPLETDPIESLSVAMSRAIGGLIVDPAFKAVITASAAAVAPSPAP
jgi:hypothetical protein